MSSLFSEIFPCLLWFFTAPWIGEIGAWQVWGKQKCRQGFSGEMWRTVATWKTGVDENTEMHLKELGRGLDSSGSGQGQIAGSYEHTN